MRVGNLLGRFSASGEEASVLESVEGLLLGGEEKLWAVSVAALWMREVQVFSHWVDLTLDGEVLARDWRRRISSSRYVS